MHKPAKNSMAEIMTVLVTVVMWISAIIGLIGIPILGLGLLASQSGGEAQVSGIHALSEGVTSGQLILGLLGLIIMVPGLIFLCVQMRRILLTLVEGDPFVPENASRLSRIGLTLAIMELLRLGTIMVVRTIPGLFDGTLPRLSTQLVLWASVAALFILSQVFREGTRLRDEEKMTI